MIIVFYGNEIISILSLKFEDFEKIRKTMFLQVDRYTTSKFILKDDESVFYIKTLVELLQDHSNLSMGSVIENDYYAKLVQYGDRTFKFISGGYLDSAPELKYFSFNKKKEKDIETNDEVDHDPICIFSEIQKNLEKGTWFFVENHSIEEYCFSSYIALYSEGGKVVYNNSHQSKIEMLKNMRLYGEVD